MDELMEGVRVLSESVIKINNYGSVLLTLFIILIICIIVGVLGFIYDEHIIQITCIILGGVCVIGMTPFAFIIPNLQTQYKVTISETVNFKEFTQKYEVISVDGEIYTVVEKKVEEE